jgi:thioredoxin reductase (NADPH)
MLLEDRMAQIVPTLSAAQIQFALRFASGAARQFSADEKLLDVGIRLYGWSSMGLSSRAGGMV